MIFWRSDSPDRELTACCDRLSDTTITLEIETTTEANWDIRICGDTADLSLNNLHQKSEILREIETQSFQVGLQIDCIT